MGSSIQGGEPEEVFGSINEGLKNVVSMTDNTYYFYLVDELTGRPVTGESSIYPIEITTPAVWVPKLLPVMQVGLTAASVFNG